jgi:hypothetical protein
VPGTFVTVLKRFTTFNDLGLYNIEQGCVQFRVVTDVLVMSYKL